MVETNDKKEFSNDCKNRENKRQYLQFIQDVITRHNTNSFQIKQFTIAIMVAVFGVFVANGGINPNFLLIPIFAIIFLSILDAIYLMQEKQFRDLFKDAVSDKIDMYSMDIRKYKYCFFEVFFTKTIMTFYIPLIVANFLVYCFLLFHSCRPKIISLITFLTRGFNG